MAMTEAAAARGGGIEFHHRGAFWSGTAAVTLGVVLMLPMYLGNSSRTCPGNSITPDGPVPRALKYCLVGLRPDGWMWFGMLLTLVGLVATAYGLFPRLSQVSRGYVSRIRVRALDDAPIRPAHVALLLVMAAAVTIDVMKPTTLAFVVPGMAKEYILRAGKALNAKATVPVAWLPLAGITGTVLGSFLWGWFGDRIGRRASILLAAVLFIATAACGSMPYYTWNFITCFIMGLGVGGMLPITFALMAETIPARHRGWLMVLIGGDVAGAYIITSWLASTIGASNHYGWRILWLLSLPTGVILIVLNRWIPESPRFLLQHGRDEEAQAIMERYGAVVVQDDVSDLDVEKHVRSRWAELLSSRFAGLSLVVLLLGIGVGMVQFGFTQWIPSNLQGLGLKEVDSFKVLRDSALIGFPLNFPIAWLYGFWGAKRTIALMAAITAAALFGFVFANPDSLVHVSASGAVSKTTLLYILLIVPIWGISSLTAVAVAYASEVYPTRIRSRGTGLAAGATKFGGVLVLAVVVAKIATPSISLTALYGAIPITAALVAILILGVETRKKQLEQITAEELKQPTTV
ncbi:MAG TPA: MFS transporter [Actinomycetota bacterium]|nr:MFS transporter [Actinomycetota bacterium]